MRNKLPEFPSIILIGEADSNPIPAALMCIQCIHLKWLADGGSACMEKDNNIIHRGILTQRLNPATVTVISDIENGRRRKHYVTEVKPIGGGTPFFCHSRKIQNILKRQLGR